MNLDNDAEVLKYTRQEKVPGGIKFILPMAEGDPITTIYKEKSGSQYAAWCNFIRQEIRNRERKNREAAAARSAEVTSSIAGKGNSTEVSELRGGEVPVPQGLPTTESEMEELLSNTLSSVKEEIAARQKERDTIDARLESLYVQCSKLEMALKAYTSYGKRESADEDSE